MNNGRIGEVSRKRRGISRRTFLGALTLLAGMLVAVGTGAVTAPVAGEEAGGLPSVVSGGADHTIKQWGSSGKLIGVVGSHDDSVNALFFVPGSEVLISLGADKTWKSWRLDGAAKADTSVDTQGGSGTALALSPDGKMVATESDGHRIRLWNRLTGRKMAEIEAHGDTIHALRFTSDGGLLVSAGADKLIRTWRVKNEGKAVSLEYNANIVAHDETITSLSLSPDDKTIASGSEDGYLKLWRTDGSGLIHRIRVGEGVHVVAFSPDGRTVATGDEDGKIRLWNAATGMALPFSGGHERAVYALAWTPDSKLLVSGGADKTLRYWDVATGKQLASIAAHDGAVRAVAIVP